MTHDDILEGANEIYKHFEAQKECVQLEKHVEEVGELIQGIKNKDRENIIEEIADTFITSMYVENKIEDVIKEYKIEREEVIKQIEYKIKRTKELYNIGGKNT